MHERVQVSGTDCTPLGVPCLSASSLLIQQYVKMLGSVSWACVADVDVGVLGRPVSDSFKISRQQNSVTGRCVHLPLYVRAL